MTAIATSPDVMRSGRSRQHPTPTVAWHSRQRLSRAWPHRLPCSAPELRRPTIELKQLATNHRRICELAQSAERGLQSFYEIRRSRPNRECGPGGSLLRRASVRDAQPEGVEHRADRPLWLGQEQHHTVLPEGIPTSCLCRALAAFLLGEGGGGHGGTVSKQETERPDSSARERCCTATRPPTSCRSRVSSVSRRQAYGRSRSQLQR